MDKYDRAAEQLLVSRDELWERDTIYPGSCVLSAAGRVERDRLAREFRATSSDFSAEPPSSAGTLTLQTYVYVVVAEEGEFSNREEWIAGIYLTRSEAESLADSSRQTAAKKRSEWKSWTERREYLLRNFSWAERAAAIDRLGPKPELHEADSFAVVEVPIGQHGRWSAFNPT